MLKRFAFWMSVLLMSGFLAACDTAEERAQEHYKKGMALLEDGDVDRALVEFRNVFKLNGLHKEARIAYAQVQEGRGNLQDAYSQYLRLVEQYPENLIGRRALSRMASDLNNWEEVERHVVVAERLAPEDPVVLAVRAGLDYRNALRDDNMDTAALAVKVSETLLSDHPDLPSARRVVIDDLVRREDWLGALAVIENGIAIDADDRSLYFLRLGVLEQLGRSDDIIAQLKDMVQQFPDADLHQTLVTRYMVENRLDEAEAYLRERVAQDSSGDPQAQLELLAFLRRTQGRDAATAEIDRVLRAGQAEHEAVLRSVRAGFEFDAGNRDAAIAEMEDILKDAEPSEQTDRIKVALAGMLIQTGNAVGARARVEEVLEHDPGQVGALKLKANWLIEDDRPGDALIELRAALDQAPRDSGIMTLMAQAHQRTGNHDLMGEMLALAVEASASAPEESARYARFLMEEEKFLAAEDVLRDALRRQNTNPGLLSLIGNLYIRMEDWPRTQGVINRLQSLNTEQTLAVANELTARKLAGQNQATELEQFLTGLSDGDSGLQAAASIVRLRLAQGNIQGALDYVAELRAQDPDNLTLRFLHAGVKIANGQREEAIADLTELSADIPQEEAVWIALYRLYRSQGEMEKVDQVLNDALANLPDSANLKWALAGEAEASGDIDGAIAIYEALYAQNSDSTVIANNLASLIASYREDDESLQRAYNIARRLRGTEVPAFQDTYGWIAHRLGNHEEALDYLEAAAQAIPGDPIAQYHLAENYAALGRDAEALGQYNKVVELVESGGGTRPAYMDRVKAEIERLSQPKE